MSPSGSGYDEGCGPNGRYAYGTSPDNTLSPPAYILMARMESPSR